MITDQTMPGIPGTELLKRIQEVRPDIPVILCAGMNDIIDEKTMKIVGIRELLVKPMDMSELKSAVGRILDSRGGILQEGK